MSPDDTPRPEEEAGEPAGPGRPEPEDEIPLGQRIYDSPFVLLAIGLLVMLICFTGWGLWEIARMTEAPLP